MSTPTVLRDLREREAAARQRRDYHHQKFDRALSSLKALGERCPGVTSPHVQAAGTALSKATRGNVEAPFMAFVDAILEHSRACAGKDPGGSVVRLATRAMDHMRELAHHVDREAEALRELQLFRHTLASVEAARDKPAASRGPGA
ncbi:hypothetical protein [Halomonas sp. LBP4]|uniref:hypothetical protein n=1 Tax=Halomonas sp. LBP4 TaxID=2044917 RepID=UPI000D765B40|nr:hypothetical protein [Halomonas sp. LBP4]PXX94996.1 hypothetical protein CR157_20490 [Halomonas sp. LBP4]